MNLSLLPSICFRASSANLPLLLPEGTFELLPSILESPPIIRSSLLREIETSQLSY